ncbi:MAG: MFS transporter [Bryobacteraceae bacterium]
MTNSRTTYSLQHGLCAPDVRLGLTENWRQFVILVIVNAFVGAMAGAERVVLPLLAGDEFGLASRTAILSFIVSFGLVKAGANLVAGRLGDRIGRKRVLIIGWLFGAPVPVLLYLAPSWSWIVMANVLLGVNQGLTWSTTVIMKIDLAGPKRRGLAMGLNEAAGYLAVSGAALVTGYLAGAHGYRMALLWVGGAAAFLGLLFSLVFVRDSRAHAEAEGRIQAGAEKSFREIFWLASWKNRTLFSVSQAGMVNNVNDGMAWGLFPLYFASEGLSLREISQLGALYPAVWGLTQLVTGALSDRLGRKPLITSGMALQGAAILSLPFTHGFASWALAAILLGVGTAMVYPTLLAAIGDVAHPSWRASAVGVYRLWRDGGYAIGALLAGLTADAFGLRSAIGLAGVVTILSGLLSFLTMRETLTAEAGPAPGDPQPMGAK